MSAELRVMDLFSGIGGFSLGLKRAGGFKTVAYCEIDPYCQQVLQARMRDGSLDTAPICTDITKLDGKPWRGGVDLICGGFPCQDISSCGLRAGISGERSGLWGEMFRIICDVRPEYVLVENVAALLERGMDRVLGDLAQGGFDAEWSIVSACSMGAPHMRERVFIVAYSDSVGSQTVQRKRRKDAPLLGERYLASSESALLQVRSGLWRESPRRFVGMAYGVPNRVERVTALGNAVVPSVVEWIGRRIRECVTEL